MPPGYRARVAGLGAVAWPPEPIHTERLTLRRSASGDRAGLIELHASAEVYRYLGGPRDRAELERVVPALPGDRPGFFAVERDGEFVGTVTFDRRDPERPGRVHLDGHDVEVSYLFLPAAWGAGYATEAVGAALDWVTSVLPGQPVVVCTQVANVASVRLAQRLGFTEVDRFEEFGAEQWLGVRLPPG